MRMSLPEIDYYRPIADAQESRNRYRTSSSRWKRGSINEPTLCGYMGEHAFAKYASHCLQIPVQVDTTTKRSGDGGFDFIIFGRRIQVKTRGHPKDCLLRRQDEHDKLLEITWHIFVSCTCSFDFRLVTLDGYIKAEDYTQLADFKKGRRGDWMNLELEDKHLYPMSRLITALELCRDWNKE